MIDHSHVVLKPEVIAQENEVYRRQKFLFVLIDILFVSHIVNETLINSSWIALSDIQSRHFHCLCTFIYRWFMDERQCSNLLPVVLDSQLDYLWYLWPNRVMSMLSNVFACGIKFTRLILIAFVVIVYF